MTTYRNRRARQEQTNQEETGAGKKTRRRASDRLVREGVFMPVIIKDYSDGISTSNGKEMSSYVLEHLVSGEPITATVFENEAPNYIDERILDAVLPEELNEFDAEDLVGCGFNVVVKYNEKYGRTFTNIVDAKPLDDEQQELLDEQLEALSLKNQRHSKEIRESVDMLSEMNNDDISSHSPMEEVSMEEMEAPDPYAPVSISKELVEDEEESESTPITTRPDRRRKYPRASEVTEAEDDSDLDEYDDDIDMDSKEDFEFYFCDECQDKGCEECDDHDHSLEDDEIED